MHRQLSRERIKCVICFRSIKPRHKERTNKARKREWKKSHALVFQSRGVSQEIILMVKHTLICNALFTQRNVTVRRFLKFSWLPHVLRSDKKYRVSVKRANSRTEKCLIDFRRTQQKWVPKVSCNLAEKGQKMRYLKGSISNKMRGRRTNIREPTSADMNSWGPL